MSESLWFSIAGANLLLVAHSKANPDDGAWLAVVNAIRAAADRQSALRILVLTDGGAPNGSQRAELAKISKDHEMRIGVVSDATSVRFVASSIALFNRSIKTFSPSEWRGACTHLGLSAPELALVQTSLQEANRYAGGGRFATVAAVLATAS